MEFRMREALRKSRIFLIENVVFQDLCDHLIVQDIFSDSMLDHIKAGNEPIEKIRRMLDYLTKRPDSCFQKFLSALSNSGHAHCAHHVREVYVRSGPTQISSQPEPQPMQQSVSELYKPVTYYPSIGNPSSAEVPMESSCSELPEKSLFSVKNCGTSFEMLSASGSASYGFPETGSGVSSFPGSGVSFPGSGVSFPVQESSATTENVPPRPLTLQSSVSFESSYGGSVSSSEGHHDNLTVYQRHYHSNQSNVYRMLSNPRGLALVINNQEFKTMTARNGSKRDMENLHILFKNLGFDICHQVDKTAAEMKALLESFAKYDALGRVDALAVIILSHGGRDGVIYGKDGHHSNNHAQAYVTDEEIRNIFSARNCPLMAQKPKLVIVQACRGRNEDMADSPGPRSPGSISHSLDSMVNDGSSPMSSVTSTASSRTANMADMCLIHSTVPGYVSYRHPVEGSPFVKVLTEVFTQKSTREHLMDMMAEVSQRLAGMQLQEDLRTIPCTTGTLTKKWFLNPLNFHW
ncbi:caspase-7-like [Littorina saxatilis]|uniref:caspase-7-like n=1 Tax=Littorina saxatilis TaxID=31220 RepID=UPI0038B49053